MDELFKIYGVGNCELNEKLLEILEDAEVDFEFYDFRDFPPSEEQLKEWGEFEGDEFPINQRSSLFKKNKKNFKKMSDSDKVSWLQEHYHCLTRPIVLDENDEVLAIGGRPERLASKVFKLEKDY